MFAFRQLLLHCFGSKLLKMKYDYGRSAFQEKGPFPFMVRKRLSNLTDCKNLALLHTKKNIVAEKYIYNQWSKYGINLITKIKKWRKCLQKKKERGQQYDLLIKNLKEKLRQKNKAERWHWLLRTKD